MNVENVVGGGHDRAQRTGAAQLGAVFAAAEHLVGPDAVEVVDDLAVLERLARIEGVVGLDVREAQRQRADERPHTGVEQVLDGDHAADLVTVRQGIDQHVRAGPASLETMHVVDAGVALAVGGKVALDDLDGGGGNVCHGV